MSTVNQPSGWNTFFKLKRVQRWSQYPDHMSTKYIQYRRTRHVIIIFFWVFGSILPMKDCFIIFGKRYTNNEIWDLNNPVKLRGELICVKFSTVLQWEQPSRPSKSKRTLEQDSVISQHLLDTPECAQAYSENGFCKIGRVRSIFN